MNSTFNFTLLRTLLSQGKQEEAKVLLTQWAKTPMKPVQQKKKGGTFLNAVFAQVNLISKVNRERFKFFQKASSVLGFLDQEERLIDDQIKLKSVKDKLAAKTKVK